MARNGSTVKDAAGNVGQATTLSPSLVRRVSQGLKYIVRGADAAWMGPMQPLEPVAQQAAGRTLDYAVGYNQRTRPREEEGISFHQLRALADACELVRLAVETRKDQIARLAWNIKPRDDGKAPKDAGADPRIAKIEQFFRFPDKERDWGTWLRMVIEDLLVLDAPTIYRRRDKSGKPYAFNIIDGGSIKRVIDEYGLTPAPPQVAYQQILHGIPAVDYTTNDLLYLPRNPRANRIFGFGPVEQVVMTVNIALRRTKVQLNYFTEGNIPDALASCPADWRPEQVGEMQQAFDEMLSGNLQTRSGVIFIPGGVDVKFTKDAILKDEFDEWLARIVCFAFSLSPAAFVKQTNRATAQTQKETAEEEGLAPLQVWVKNMMDRLIAEDFDAPDLEFAWYDDTSTDPYILAQVNQIYVDTGIKSRNEIRSEIGLDPIPDGDEYTITTGTGVVRLSDALAPPEPVAPPAMIGHNGGPPLDDEGDGASKPGNKHRTGSAKPKTVEPEPTEPKSPNAKRKKKDLTKADDSVEGGDDQTSDAELPEPAPGSNREKELAGLIARALRQQAEKLAAKIAGSEHTSSTASEALAAAEDASFFDLDGLHAPVAVILQDSAAEAAHGALKALPAPPETAPAEQPAPTAADTAVPELNVSVSTRNITSLVNEDAAEFASRRAAELIGKKLVDGKLLDNPDAKWAITDTTRDGIRNLVQKAEQEGQSVQQLAKEIRESTLFSPARAKRIAQTELSFSANNGNLIAWKRSGVVSKKRWILGSEHIICDACDSNTKAGAIPLDDSFPSGDQCPPQHTGCICSLSPVVRFS